MTALSPPQGVPMWRVVWHVPSSREAGERFLVTHRRNEQAAVRYANRLPYRVKFVYPIVEVR